MPVLPDRSREDLITAMRQFDATQRSTYNFNRNTYVVCFEGRGYPPKVIISLATGRSTREFSGGEVSHRYLIKRGFEIAAK